MQSSDYLKACLKTEAVLDDKKPRNMSLIMSALDVAAKAGALVDLVKRQVVYGQDVKSDAHKLAITNLQNSLEDHENAATCEPVLTETNLSMRLIHASLGMVTEPAELAETFSKVISDPKTVLSEDQKLNCKEEAGDTTWYLSILLDEIGESYENVFRANIAKLAERYKNKGFTQDNALYRDVAKELEALLLLE